MDLVLLTITIGALGLSIGLGVIGWKLLRHASTDSDARVEQLRALADALEIEVLPDRQSSIEPAAAMATATLQPIAATATPVALPDTLRVVEPPAPLEVPVFARLASFGGADASLDEPELEWDAPIGHHQESAADPIATTIFRTPVPAAPARRFALAGAVAVLMLGSVGTAYAVYRPQMLASYRAPDGMVPAATVPLELLSLKETTDAEGTFTVTGLVGNPSAGHAASRVMAVVYLFDREGHYFATGRASLDQLTLAPGDQSPFVVKIAQGATAARYRVGFRELDGAVVAHVDHRAQGLEGTLEAAASTSKGASH